MHRQPPPTEPAHAPLPTLTADGRPVPVRPGQTLHAALRDAGVDVPGLCDDVRLDRPHGTCGLCVVEVKGGHVSRRDGQWVQGSGTRAHEIDPVFQARRARHTLHDLLRQHGLQAWRARAADLVVLALVYCRRLKRSAVARLQ